MTITIGSLFSGIGGFELGLERAIPESSTIWQVEQDKYCQSILKKHWPESILYDDVCSVGAHNLKPVDIICGGFPCQDISKAGKGKGINEGKKSGLYWEMFRIICELRPRIIVMENVSALTNRGLSDVLGSLATIGYDAEWICITAAMFGAPHRRKRLFVVAHPRCEHFKEHTSNAFKMEKKNLSECQCCKDKRLHIENYWQKTPIEPGLCSLDDGIPQRVAKLRALGNAIVPQCSQWIGEHIVLSGLLDSSC